MPAVRKLLLVAAVVAIAAVGGFAVARAVSTGGPDPKVDDPVVVRPADDSDTQKTPDDSAGSGEQKSDRDKGNNPGKGKDNRGSSGKDDRGDDDRDDSGPGRGRDDDDDDDWTPVNPSPGTYDDDDDDDDDGDDDGGDD
ncbi:hypothetical protein MU582_08265 [Nocardioidaceae bacterium SCSIO 66511]|nr:hypothetical protein MU582_08265 [Nocardioidaceae bacterium SCSIO 66511]